MYLFMCRGLEFINILPGFFQCHFFFLLFLARPCQYSKMLLLLLTYHQQNNTNFITPRNCRTSRKHWFYYPCRHIDGYQKLLFFLKCYLNICTLDRHSLLFKHFQHGNELLSKTSSCSFQEICANMVHEIPRGDWFFWNHTKSFYF